MTTNQDAAAGKILRFPLERRLKGRQDQRTIEAAEEPRASFDSWYHEAAIREERVAKH